MPDNVINIYNTRAMAEMVRFEPGVARFLRETFFPDSRVKLYDTDTIDIDIVQGGRPIACMVKKYEDGNLVEDSGFETNSFKTGYLNEFKESKAEDYLKRKPQENPYDYTPPAVQAQQKLQEDFKELVDRQNRAEEVMAVEVLTTGKFTGRNKDGVKIYEADYKMRLKHQPVLEPAKMWDKTGVTKNDVLETIRQDWIVNLLQKDGGRMPTHMILGHRAFNAFLRLVDPDNQNSSISSFRAFRGEVTPRMEEMGVFFLGKFPELGNIDVIGYNEWYDDPWDGETKPIFPADTALLLSKNARYDRQYGKINHREAPDRIARYPYTWYTDNRKKMYVQLESAPLLSPYEIDTIVSATVTGTTA